MWVGPAARAQRDEKKREILKKAEKMKRERKPERDRKRTPERDMTTKETSNYILEWDRGRERRRGGKSLLLRSGFDERV